MRILLFSATLVAVSGCTAVDSFQFTFPDGGGGDLSGSDGPPALDGSTGDQGPRCGLPGLACCNRTPACSGGGCCTSGGTCVASGEDLPSAGGSGQVCLDGSGVACGLGGAPCCGNLTCHNGGCCVGGICADARSVTGCGPLGVCNPMSKVSCQPIAMAACGGNGDRCCPPGTSGRNAPFCVASGLACSPDTSQCEPCGQPGQVCCEANGCAGGCCVRGGGGPKCVAEGSQCGSSGTCASGGCSGCGQLGQPCCAAPVRCTAAFTYCGNQGLCAPCGGRGESCCEGNFGGGWCSEPFGCGDATNLCEPCGAAGQRCCPGDVCNAGTCSASGTC